MGLALSRKRHESVQIGEAKVTVVAIEGDRVALHIEAPQSVKILRSELLPHGQPADAGGDRNAVAAEYAENGCNDERD